MDRNVEKREEFHGQDGGNPHGCRGGGYSLKEFLTSSNGGFVNV